MLAHPSPPRGLERMAQGPIRSIQKWGHRMGAGLVAYTFNPITHSGGSLVYRVL